MTLRVTAFSYAGYISWGISSLISVLCRGEKQRASNFIYTWNFINLYRLLSMKAVLKSTSIKLI